MSREHDKQIAVRVTKAEWLRLRVEKEKAGYSSLSEYLRMTIKKILDSVDNVNTTR